MSRMYKKVKDYYDRGLWTADMVRNAVIKSWITEEEFQIITKREE
ncbi:MAG: XkdX family protein [Ruminococcus sp.]|nr:XkdX family protein [Ruminococcus sp.]